MVKIEKVKVSEKNSSLRQQTTKAFKKRAIGLFGTM